MACFKLSKKLIKDLLCLIADFWWGSKAGKIKMHWSKWNEICNGKERGGMGFRDLGCVNQAMLAKQGWRLIRYLDSLVGKVLKACYFPHSDFFNVKKGKHASLVWSGIVWGMEVIDKGSRWRVGFGLGIDIFKDRWFPTPHLFKISSSPPFPGNFKVDMLRLESGDWNSALIKHLFDVEEAKVILSLPVRSFNHADVLFWHFTNDGEYTVKSGYKVVFECRGFIEPSKPDPMQH
ncbi:hypothetical protein UlMin_043060 [Ulmus minor]